MKKGIFTIMHYIMPKTGVLSLHSSANEGAAKGDVTLFFGLSGTGKVLPFPFSLTYFRPP
jgi:phosphoenolpyruvate carboxykinase (ATP)